MKESDIFGWGGLINWKALLHFIGFALVFWAAHELTFVLNIDRRVQDPKIFAGVVTFAGVFLLEFIQMAISKAKIDVADILTGILAIVTMWIIL